jgi:threonine synthase
MDVGDPSNFERLASLFDGDLRSMRRLIRGSSWTDDATRETIRLVHDRCGYVLDPHTAVAYRAWQEYLGGSGGTPVRRPGIVLATAHPAKFLEAYDERVRASVPIPDRLSARMGQPKRSLPMPARYEDFKDYLCDTRTGGVRK